MIEGLKLFGLWLSGLSWNYIISIVPYYRNKISYWKVKYLLKVK